MKYTLPSFIMCLILSVAAFAQGILLDEDFSDWASIEQLDDTGDNSATLGLESLAVTNDEEFLYFRVVFDREINLQSQNVILDIENQAFRLEYKFGDGEGRLFRSGTVSDVFHPNIQLITSPTVSSNQFEMRLGRRWNVGSNSVNLDSDIQIVMRIGINGDRLPDNGSITYAFDESRELEIQPFNPERISETDMRICSYNVLRDRIFDSDARAAYTRLLNSINADIYCFQEIYDHDSGELLNRLFNIFGVLEGSQWFDAKRGGDLILISKYPILFAREIAGNAVFVVDKDGQDIMVVNVHFACCERNNDREEEIDALLRFLREARLGNENYDLEEGTPLIITGDTNFVGNADQLEAILSGDIFNNGFYGPDFNPDWDNVGRLADVKPLTANTNVSYTWFSDFSSFSPGRLDFVFFTDSQLEQQNAFVLDTRALSTSQLNQNGLEFLDSNIASDHRPIVADFRFQVSDVEDLSETAFPLPYPNPTYDWINVSPKFRGELSLINLQGQVISTIHGNRISTNGLPSGIYLLKMLNDRNQVGYHKVLINPI